MNREQLTQLQQVATQKATYLRSKASPGERLPGWIIKELEFVQDFERLGIALYEAEQKAETIRTQYSRLLELLTTMEAAVNQLIRNRSEIVSRAGTLQPYQVGPAIILRLASLTPPGTDKNQLLQFYHEYSTKILYSHGTGTAQTDNSHHDTRSQPT
jgi:hypothetical protein